ncbi:hypothetical protein D3C71_808630 [compost metagenome]
MNPGEQVLLPFKRPVYDPQTDGPRAGILGRSDMSAGMTVQVVGHEAGKEDNVPYTRLTVVNSRGRFHVKFKGAKAEHLTRDLVATLSEGETISTKRLFIELFGEFTSFTRPGSTFKVRFFKADDYKVIDGPSLELARLRGEALQTLQNAESLRNAGALAQAYKIIATYTAELAQFPLDLSEFATDDALLGEMGSEEDFNPEAAAAAHYDREEAAAQSQAAQEDAEIDASIPFGEGPADDLDEVVMSAAADENLSDVPESDAMGADSEGTTVYQMLNALREPVGDADASEDVEPAADAEEENSDDDEVAEEQEETAAPTPAPARARAFGRFGRR